MNKKIIALSSLLLTSLFTLASCQNVLGTGGDLDKIVAKKTLVIGTNAEYAPFEYLSGASQKIVGFDIDVVKLIEEKIEATYDIDLNVVIKDMNFDGLIGSMNSNQIDLIAAAFTKTEEREKTDDPPRGIRRARSAGRRGRESRHQERRCDHAC